MPIGIIFKVAPTRLQYNNIYTFFLDYKRSKNFIIIDFIIVYIIIFIILLYLYLSFES